MKKIEFGTVTLSIMINLILVLILPGIKIEDVGDKKIQVGLVALERKAPVKAQPKPVVPPKRQEVKKPEVKPPQPKPEPVRSFETLAKSIEAPKLDPRNMVSRSNRVQPSTPRIEENKKLETRDNRLDASNQEHKFSTDDIV
ncbi:MAG: hypothetical protein ACRCZH_03155, partial [Cetobacterium sp.]